MWTPGSEKACEVYESGTVELPLVGRTEVANGLMKMAQVVHFLALAQFGDFDGAPGREYPDGPDSLGENDGERAAGGLRPIPCLSFRSSRPRQCPTQGKVALSGLAAPD